jgi:hypothetical protein
MLRLRRYYSSGMMSGLLLIFFVTSGSIKKAAGEDGGELRLTSGWTVQSSCQVQSTGAEISKVNFRTQGWHVATVPSTVVNALVADGTYPDPFYGKNLESMAGIDYVDKTKPFSYQDMPPGSPFRCSWWYRTEFRLPEQYGQGPVWLHFDGINYRANIWVNGQKLADARDVAGTFRTFEFEASKWHKCRRQAEIQTDCHDGQLCRHAWEHLSGGL